MAATVRKLVELVVPEDLENYVLNPVAAGGGNYANLAGGTVSVSTTYGRFGRKSYRVQTSADGDGGTFTTKGLTNATHTLSFYVVGGTIPTKGLRIGIGSNYYLAVAAEYDGTHTRYYVTFPAGQANGGTTFRIAQNGTGSGDFYITGLLAVPAAYLTTYFDGDFQKFIEIGEGFRWTGAAHASSSKMYARIRGTGRANTGYGKLVDLADLSANIVLSAASGLGVGPVDHILEGQPLTPGKAYASTQFDAATMVMTLRVAGRTLADLHAIRQNYIIEYIQIAEVVRLRYHGANSSDGTSRVVERDHLYAGGLDWNQIRGFNETIALQLLAPDPRWYYASETAYEITSFSQTLSSDNAFARLEEQWTRLGSGPGGDVRDWCKGPDGTIYAALLSGTVRKWDNYAGSWTTLGTVTGSSAQVWGVDIDPSGTRLYITGSFTAVNGMGAINVAQCTIATSTWAAMHASGITGTTQALRCSLDGSYVYVTGSLTAAGGSAVSNIARWSIAGSAWSQPGTGLSGVGRGLTPAPNGDMYVCGDQATAGTVTSPSISSVSASSGGSLAASTTYYYCIAARTGAGRAAVGATNNGTTTGTNKTLTVSWSAATGATHYDVFRGLSSGAGNQSYLTTVTTTSFVDDGSLTTSSPSSNGFTANDGARSARVARWSAAEGAFYSVGSTGFTGGNSVWGLALDTNGALYATGECTSADGQAAARAAMLIGNQWVPMGLGLNNTAYKCAIGPDGLVYFAGTFTTTGDVAQSYLAAWTGGEQGQWIRLEATPSAALFSVMVAGRDIYVGTVGGAATMTAPAYTTVSYGATMGGRPRLEMSGPISLVRVANLTTDEILVGRPLTIADGEECTIYFEPPVGPAVISKSRGKIIEQIEGVSDLAQFHLGPGSNVIGVTGTGTSGNTWMRFVGRLPHFSADAGVG